MTGWHVIGRFHPARPHVLRIRPRPRPLPADRGHCCNVGACVYTPDKIAFYLTVIHQLERIGEDAGEAAAGVMASQDKFGRTSTVATISPTVRVASLIWDVQEARRRAGPSATAAELAQALCPWALADGARD